MKKTDLKKLEKCIENEGWNIQEDAKNEFTISIGSPEGQDANFAISGSDHQEFCDSLSKVADCYDPDEQATFWIGPDGHGSRGAPHSLSDLVKDMEWVKSKLQSLSEKCNEI